MGEVVCPKVCVGWRCRRVARAGVVYRCASALASELGVSRGAVHQSLHRHGDAEHCGRKRGVKVGATGGNRREVRVGVHAWPSVTAMAVDLGVERSGLSKKLSTDAEWVVAKVMAWNRRREGR